MGGDPVVNPAAAVPATEDFAPVAAGTVDTEAPERLLTDKPMATQRQNHRRSNINSVNR